MRKRRRSKTEGDVVRAHVSIGVDVIEKVTVPIVS